MTSDKADTWKVVVLEHDQASKEIADFFEKIWAEGIIRKKIVKNDIAREKKNISKMTEEAVGNLEGKILTLYGHGCYHYYTYGLCNAIARKKSDDYMYIHVDNHDDSYYENNGYLGCGSFVKNILEEPEANDILLIGPSYSYGGLTLLPQEILLKRRGEKNLEKVLAEKKQKDVYTSLDLDLLDDTEIKTGYNQGKLKLNNMLEILHIINEKKNIISADILGFSGGSRYDHGTHVSLLAYTTLAAKITGKDTKELENMHRYFGTPRSREEFEKIANQLKV